MRPARDFAFESNFILPALARFLKDPTLALVNNPFLPGAVKISTSTRVFLVGDSDVVTGSESGEEGRISALPGMKDADKGLLCRGVDLGLGVVGIGLGVDRDLVGDGGPAIVDLRHGGLEDGWMGVGGGRSTSILSSSTFCFFVPLALCLFDGRGLTEESSSSGSASAFAFVFPFVDPTDTDILSELDDTILARSSSSLSSSSIVRLLRLRRDVVLRRGAGGS